MTQSQSWAGNPTTRPTGAAAGPDYPDKVQVHLGGQGASQVYEIDLFRYGRGNCPECGVPLADQNCESHAVFHYGTDEPTPVREHLLARMRRAVILGKPLPEA